MDLNLRDKSILPCGTICYQIDISDANRIYFGYFLESFEGWCNYTTLSKEKPYLRVDVSPNFEDNFEDLFSFLKNWEI